MAGGLIGRVLVDWNPETRTWEINRAYKESWENLQARAGSYARDKPYQVSLAVTRATQPRTLRQNRMMWALLTIMAREMGGGRIGDVSPEDCYIQMLERYGARFDFLEVPAGAIPILYNSYRVVHVVEILDNDRCSVKAGMGSSSFTTVEMKDLIDGIFDQLAEMGVEDPEVTDYWRQWHECEK